MVEGSIVHLLTQGFRKGRMTYIREPLVREKKAGGGGRTSRNFSEEECLTQELCRGLASSEENVLPDIRFRGGGKGTTRGGGGALGRGQPLSRFHLQILDVVEEDFLMSNVVIKRLNWI